MIPQVYLYRRPDTRPTASFLVNGRTYSCWTVSRDATVGTPLGGRFEDVFESLSKLPGIYVEPDGSFLWLTEDENGGRNSLSGTLFDNGERLQYAEIHGHCTANYWTQFLECFCGTPQSLSGLLLLEQRRLVAADDIPQLWLESSLWQS